MNSNDFINSILKKNSVKNATVDDFIVLSFYDIGFQNEKDILIEGINFQNGASFRDLSTSGNLQFSNCKFNGHDLIEFINLKCRNLSFVKCSFVGYTTIKNIEANVCNLIRCSSLQGIEVSNCKVFRFIYRFDENSKNTELSIDSNEILNTEIYTNNGRLDQFNCFNVHRLRLQGNFGSTHLFMSKFEEMIVGRESNEIITQIDELVYTNRAFEGHITIQNTNIKALNFQNLNTNNGKIKLFGVNIDTSKISNCSLSGFELSLVKFNDTLTLVRCNLDGLKLFNVIWPKNQVLEPNLMKRRVRWFYRFRKTCNPKHPSPYTDEELNELKFQRDTYRQLKGVSNSNGNEIEALVFYKNEMRLYWKEIRVIGGLSAWDHFLIFLNRNASNFGQSYIRPLIGMLSFHLLFCVGIWISEAPDFDLNTYWNTVDLSNGVADYLTWLNPIYKTPENWKSTAIIFGFFTRIVNGFFIYHFIRAIRKYGKS